MKTLVALALLIITAFTYVVADSRPSIPVDVASLTNIAEWAGCRGVLVVDTGIANAYFGLDTVGRPIIVIGTEFPDQHRFIIFLHELGHCLQYTEGLIMNMTPNEKELDADGRAAQLACALHMDGPKMLLELFAWVQERYGYEGDPDHGTLAQRIEQGNRAKHWCPSVQS